MSATPGGDASQHCLLCGQLLPSGVALPVCREHMLRSDLGEDGPDARGWLFRHGESGWLLFRAEKPAAGAPGKGLRSEWKAVNETSREVRHFPQAEEIDVWLDLLGSQPVGRGEPGADFSEAFKDVPNDGIQRQFVIFCENLLNSPRPVYGPAQPVYGLALGSMHSSGHGGATEIDSLTFASLGAGKSSEPDQADLLAAKKRLDADFVAQATKLKQEQSGKPGGNWGWHSHPLPPAGYATHQPFPASVLKLTYAYNLTYDARWDEDLPDDRLGSVNEYIAHQLLRLLPDESRELLGEESCRRLCKHAAGSFWEYAPDLVDAVSSEDIKGVQHQFTVDGKGFDGDLLYWSLSRPVCSFRLSRIEAGPVVYRLDGEVYNLDLDQLLSIVENLAVINGRADVVARYAAQLAELDKRLRSYYSQ